jgi:transposase
LFTRNGKALTAKGVKPICPFHQIFQTIYLFGAFSPITGESFLLEMQVYLNELSTKFENVYNILILDNGAFHKAKSLIIPENISLLFLPPYSPELNPAENMWGIIKRKFTNKLHHTLEEVSEFITKATAKITKEAIKKTCGFSYIFSETIWTR